MRDVNKMLDTRPFKSSFYLTGFPSEQKNYGELYADQVFDDFVGFFDGKIPPKDAILHLKLHM